MSRMRCKECLYIIDNRTYLDKMECPKCKSTVMDDDWTLLEHNENELLWYIQKDKENIEVVQQLLKKLHSIKEENATLLAMLDANAFACNNCKLRG